MACWHAFADRQLSNVTEFLNWTEEQARIAAGEKEVEGQICDYESDDDRSHISEDEIECEVCGDEMEPLINFQYQEEVTHGMPGPGSWGIPRHPNRDLGSTPDTPNIEARLRRSMENFPCYNPEMPDNFALAESLRTVAILIGIALLAVPGTEAAPFVTHLSATSPTTRWPG